MSTTYASAPRHTEEQLVGEPIPPLVELGMLEAGLPESAATEDAARWALEEIARLRSALTNLLEASHHASETTYLGEGDDDPWDKARALLANLSGQLPLTRKET